MTRHELKEQLQHDRFTDTVSEVVGYAATHRKDLTRWIIIAIAVVAVAGGIFWYLRYQNSVRERDLNNAFAVAARPVGPAAPGAANSFPTESAKTQAVTKAFSDVVAKDGGSKQGYIAEYYLGTLKAKNGDNQGAEAELAKAADSGSEIAPLAKVALAQLLAGDNKLPQAQSLLQSIVDKPTDLVSKAQAEILLARLDESSNPQQAKKMLQTVSSDSKDPVVQRVAQQVSSELNK